MNITYGKIVAGVLIWTVTTGALTGLTIKALNKPEKKSLPGFNELNKALNPEKFNI